MPVYYSPSPPKATSYIWVLSKGYSKCSVRLCGLQRTSREGLRAKWASKGKGVGGYL
jgi:hypothetical protein